MPIFSRIKTLAIIEKELSLATMHVYFLSKAICDDYCAQKESSLEFEGD